MLLNGAKFICLDNNGKPAQTIVAKGKHFTIGSLIDSDYVLEQAENIHCRIEADAFGHVTIHNKSEKHPISVNGEVVNMKRTLFNNSKIKILNTEFIWQHAKTASNVDSAGATDGMSTPSKQIGIPVQPPNSCPSLKYHRNQSIRFTVHSLKSYRVDSDESNTLNETSEATTTAEPRLDTTNPVESEKPLLDVTPAKVDVVDSTPDKKTTSTEKRLKTFRNLWGWSGMTTTSYSPREAGVRPEKTFTALIAPTTPNSSICRTPKGLLERLGSEKHSTNTSNTDLLVFATPLKQSDNNANTKQGIVVHHKKSAMKILDLTTPSKLRLESPRPKALSLKKPTAAKALSSFSEKTNVSAANKTSTFTSNTPKLNTPNTVVTDIETPISTSSAITVDSSSATSDLSEASAVTSTTPARPPKTTQTITPGSILRKQALLASAKKQQQMTTTTTPVSTKRTTNTFTIEKRSAVDDSNIRTQNSQIEQTTACSISAAANNMLTTSTPYKKLDIDNDDDLDKPDSTRLHESTEFFSALHSSSDDEVTETEIEQTKEVTMSKPSQSGLKAAGAGDELLQEIEEILNKSDELKRQIQATAHDDVEDALDDDTASIVLPTVSPPPASIELIEPIIPPPSLSASMTSNVDHKKSPKNSVIASVLLKAIDNAEKQKSVSPKEDDEKENKINKSSMMTPVGSTARRRISLSTPITNSSVSTTAATVVPFAAEEVNGSALIATPLTPKRVTKRRPSIDEVPLVVPMHNRTIDHFNTENMGAIVEEEPTDSEDLAVSMNKTVASPIDRDYLTLDASAALTATLAITESTCLAKDQMKITNAADIDDEVVMSPLQCLDESFAEPCEDERKMETKEKTLEKEFSKNILEASTNENEQTTKTVEMQVLADEQKDSTQELGDESFCEVEYLEENETIHDAEQETINLTFEIENVEKELSTAKEPSIIEVLSDSEDACHMENDITKSKITDVVDEARRTVLSKSINSNKTIEVCQVDLNTLDMSAIYPLDKSLSAKHKQTVDFTLNETRDPLLMESNKTMADTHLFEKTAADVFKSVNSLPQFKKQNEAGTASLVVQSLQISGVSMLQRNEILQEPKEAGESPAEITANQTDTANADNTALDTASFVEGNKTCDVDEVEVNQSLINKIVEIGDKPQEVDTRQEDPLNIKEMSALKNETLNVDSTINDESSNQIDAEEKLEDPTQEVYEQNPLIAEEKMEDSAHEIIEKNPLTSMEVTQMIAEEKERDCAVVEMSPLASMEVTQIIAEEKREDSSHAVDKQNPSKNMQARQIISEEKEVEQNPLTSLDVTQIIAEEKIDDSSQAVGGQNPLASMEVTQMIAEEKVVEQNPFTNLEVKQMIAEEKVEEPSQSVGEENPLKSMEVTQMIAEEKLEDSAEATIEQNPLTNMEVTQIIAEVKVKESSQAVGEQNPLTSMEVTQMIAEEKVVEQNPLTSLEVTQMIADEKVEDSSQAVDGQNPLTSMEVTQMIAEEKVVEPNPLTNLEVTQLIAEEKVKESSLAVGEQNPLTSMEVTQMTAEEKLEDSAQATIEQNPLTNLEVTQIIADEKSNPISKVNLADKKDSAQQQQSAPPLVNETFLSNMEVTQMLNEENITDRAANELVGQKRASTEKPAVQIASTQNIEEAQEEKEQLVVAVAAVETRQTQVEAQTVPSRLSIDLYESDDNMEALVVTESESERRTTVDESSNQVVELNDSSEEEIAETQSEYETAIEVPTAKQHDSALALDDTNECEESNTIEAAKHEASKTNLEAVPVITLDDTTELDNDNVPQQQSSKEVQLENTANVVSHLAEINEKAPVEKIVETSEDDAANNDVAEAAETSNIFMESESTELPDLNKLSENVVAADDEVRESFEIENDKSASASKWEAVSAIELHEADNLNESDEVAETIDAEVISPNEEQIDAEEEEYVQEIVHSKTEASTQEDHMQRITEIETEDLTSKKLDAAEEPLHEEQQERPIEHGKSEEAADKVVVIEEMEERESNTSEAAPTVESEQQEDIIEKDNQLPNEDVTTDKTNEKVITEEELIGNVLPKECQESIDSETNKSLLERSAIAENTSELEIPNEIVPEDQSIEKNETLAEATKAESNDETSAGNEASKGATLAAPSQNEEVETAIMPAAADAEASDECKDLKEVPLEEQSLDVVGECVEAVACEVIEDATIIKLPVTEPKKLVSDTQVGDSESVADNQKTEVTLEPMTEETHTEKTKMGRIASEDIVVLEDSEDEVDELEKEKLETVVQTELVTLEKVSKKTEEAIALDESQLEEQKQSIVADLANNSNDAGAKDLETELEKPLEEVAQAEVSEAVDFKEPEKQNDEPAEAVEEPNITENIIELEESEFAEQEQPIGAVLVENVNVVAAAVLEKEPEKRVEEIAPNNAAEEVVVLDDSEDEAEKVVESKVQTKNIETTSETSNAIEVEEPKKQNNETAEQSEMVEKEEESVEVMAEPIESLQVSLEKAKTPETEHEKSGEDKVSATTEATAAAAADETQTLEVGKAGNQENHLVEDITGDGVNAADVIATAADAIAETNDLRAENEEEEIIQPIEIENLQQITEKPEDHAETATEEKKLAEEEIQEFTLEAVMDNTPENEVKKAAAKRTRRKQSEFKEHQTVEPVAEEANDAAGAKANTVAPTTAARRTRRKQSEFREQSAIESEQADGTASSAIQTTAAKRTRRKHSEFKERQAVEPIAAVAEEVTEATDATTNNEVQTTAAKRTRRKQSELKELQTAVPAATDAEEVAEATSAKVVEEVTETVDASISSAVQTTAAKRTRRKQSELKEPQTAVPAATGEEGVTEATSAKVVEEVTETVDASISTAVQTTAGKRTRRKQSELKEHQTAESAAKTAEKVTQAIGAKAVEEAAETIDASASSAVQTTAAKRTRRKQSELREYQSAEPAATVTEVADVTAAAEVTQAAEPTAQTTAAKRTRGKQSEFKEQQAIEPTNTVAEIVTEVVDSTAEQTTVEHPSTAALIATPAKRTRRKQSELKEQETAEPVATTAEEGTVPKKRGRKNAKQAETTTTAGADATANVERTQPENIKQHIETIEDEVAATNTKPRRGRGAQKVEKIIETITEEEPTATVEISQEVAAETISEMAEADRSVESQTKASKSKAAIKTKNTEQEEIESEIVPANSEQSIIEEAQEEHAAADLAGKTETESTAGNQRGAPRRRAAAAAPKYDETSDTEQEGHKQSRKRRSGSTQKATSPKKQSKQEITADEESGKAAEAATTAAKRNRKKKLHFDELQAIEAAETATTATAETSVPNKRVRKNAKQEDAAASIEDENAETKPKRGRGAQKPTQTVELDEAVAMDELESSKTTKKSQTRRARNEPVIEPEATEETVEATSQKTATRKPRAGKRTAEKAATVEVVETEPKQEQATLPSKRGRRLNSQIERLEPPVTQAELEPIGEEVSASSISNTKFGAKSVKHAAEEQAEASSVNSTPESDESKALKTTKSRGGGARRGKIEKAAETAVTEPYEASTATEPTPTKSSTARGGGRGNKKQALETNAAAPPQNNEAAESAAHETPVRGRGRVRTQKYETLAESALEEANTRNTTATKPVGRRAGGNKKAAAEAVAAETAASDAEVADAERAAMTKPKGRATARRGQTTEMQETVNDATTATTTGTKRATASKGRQTKKIEAIAERVDADNEDNTESIPAGETKSARKRAATKKVVKHDEMETIDDDIVDEAVVESAAKKPARGRRAAQQQNEVELASSSSLTAKNAAHNRSRHVHFNEASNKVTHIEVEMTSAAEDIATTTAAATAPPKRRRKN